MPNPPVRRSWPIERARDVERLYTTTLLPFKAISVETQVPQSTVHSLARRHGWRRPGEKDAIIRKKSAPSVSAARRRLALLARALTLTEAHLAAAENRAAEPMEPTDREREARFVATLVTLVQRHREAEAALGPRKRGGPQKNDRDLRPGGYLQSDVFNAVLARRLADFAGG